MNLNIVGLFGRQELIAGISVPPTVDILVDVADTQGDIAPKQPDDFISSSASDAFRRKLKEIDEMRGNKITKRVDWLSDFILALATVGTRQVVISSPSAFNATADLADECGKHAVQDRPFFKRMFRSSQHLAPASSVGQEVLITFGNLQERIPVLLSMVEDHAKTVLWIDMSYGTITWCQARSIPSFIDGVFSEFSTIENQIFFKVGAGLFTYRHIMRLMAVYMMCRDDVTSGRLIRAEDFVLQITRKAADELGLHSGSLAELQKLCRLKKKETA